VTLAASVWIARTKTPKPIDEGFHEGTRWMLYIFVDFSPRVSLEAEPISGIVIRVFIVFHLIIFDPVLYRLNSKI
jgi:hypothetical protein